MAILETGINKTYKSIAEAINAAGDGDEIKIYPAFYNETFDCDKELIFTGVPGDVNDFSTYPQIYNGEEEYYTSITGKCYFSNLIFVEVYCPELKDYKAILGGEKLEYDFIQKYYRERLENSYQETLCLEVENESRFENCHFIGGKNYGVVVDLKNTKNAPVFINCGFYLNYCAGIYVTGGKKSSPAAVFQNCRFAYNGNGVYGGNFELKNCEIYQNYYDGILYIENESKLEQCKVYYNACGIAGDEKGSLSINESNIHTNGSEGICIRSSAKILINNSKIHKNEDAVIMEEKSKFLAVDCKICFNYGDAFLCTGNSELTLQNCSVSDNEEKGIEATDKSKVNIYESRILNNSDDGVFASKKAQIKIRDSDSIGNRNGVHFKGQSEGIINNCAFASNKDCELFFTEKSKCEIEKSHFITKQLPKNHQKNERSVAIMCADNADINFKDCEIRSQKEKDTVLAILMGNSDGHFTDCTFKEAENGIVVYNQSGCEIKHSRFLDCLNLDIFQKSKLTSWVDFYDTELSEATKKDLSIKDYEIARKLLPELNEEDRKIISMYYNLDSKNPEEEYRLTGEELALYFNIPVKRVERAFNRLAELSEE